MKVNIIIEMICRVMFCWVLFCVGGVGWILMDMWEMWL